MSVSKTIGLPAEGGFVTWEVTAKHYAPQSASNVEVHESVTEYVNLVQDSYTIVFYLSPADAVLTVNGSVVSGSGNTRTLAGLHYGDVINWEVSKEGFLSLYDEIIVERDLTIYVSLDGLWYDHFTFTINPTPSDATVLINRQERNSVYEEVGTEITWIVTKEGYYGQGGILTLTHDTTIDVVLQPAPQYTFTIVPTPSDAIVTINGIQRTSITASDGTPIEWSVMRSGYITQNDSFILSGDQTLNVTLASLTDEPLTFEIIQDGNIYWMKNGDAPAARVIQYQINNGLWQSMSAEGGRYNSNKITVTTGDIVRFKGTNPNYDRCYFTAEANSTATSFRGAKYNVRGDITSLIGGDNYHSVTSYDSAGSTFHMLFNGAGVVDASNLVLRIGTLVPSCYKKMFYYCHVLKYAPELPATTMAESCYENMFYECRRLTDVPSLPAAEMASSCYLQMFWGCRGLVHLNKYFLPSTTLAELCYTRMFNGCINLIDVPDLPATTLAGSCYKGMFRGCSALTKAQSVLPAERAENQCYAEMFKNCVSLTEAPEIKLTVLPAGVYDVPTRGMYCCSEMFSGCASLQYAPSLPATILSQGCYDKMFSGCTSLVESPVLPATSLVTLCYCEMFSGSTNLNKITCLATDLSVSNGINNWVDGVAGYGVFFKSSGMSSWPTGSSGIPNNWAVVDYTS